MQLRFTKMQGLGNDFVIVDAVSQPLKFNAEHIRFIADRHLGIGCDQVLIVEKSTDSAVDFIYRIFNADGSEVGQCGNGARCLAKFVVDSKLTDKKTITLKTFSSLLECTLNDNDTVTVNMGRPKIIESLTLKERTGVYLSIGNPHLVFIVKDIHEWSLQEMGSYCNQHVQFPEGVNVSFMQVLDGAHILLRVYERGVGETRACGSGACAAVVAGKYQNKLDAIVDVSLPGGQLIVQYDNESSPVLMTGPAISVFEGVIQL